MENAHNKGPYWDFVQISFEFFVFQISLTVFSKYPLLLLLAQAAVLAEFN